MSRRVEFFASVQSPYCYFALDRLAEIDARAGVEVALRLVAPGVLRSPELFHGRSSMEQSYFLKDVARTAAFLGLSYAEAKPYPVAMKPGRLYEAEAVQPRISRLHRIVVAAARAGAGLAAYDRLMRLIWGGEVVDWHQGDHIARALGPLGLEADGLAAALSDEAVEAALDENHRAMLAGGHWGAPSFLLDGEIFYGQDRIDQLIWRLEGPVWSAVPRTGG